MTTDTDLLDRLDGLAEKATPGPWRTVPPLPAKDTTASVAIVGDAEVRSTAPDATPAPDRADAAYIAFLDPATVRRLVALARLGAAWQAVEAALPEDWELSLDVSGYRRDFYTATARYCYSLRYYRANVGRARFVPFEMGHGPTPAAALLALRAKLEERT